MPRKRKPAAASRQAQPPLRELLDDISKQPHAYPRLREQLRGDEFRRTDWAMLADEIKRADSDKWRQIVDADPGNFRQFREQFLRDICLAVPPAKPKSKQKRAKIPHADEAIDEMLAEMRAEPSKIWLKKSRIERVVELLDKKHRVPVGDSQKKTLGRWIKHRIAQLDESD